MHDRFEYKVSGQRSQRCMEEAFQYIFYVRPVNARAHYTRTLPARSQATAATQTHTPCYVCDNVCFERVNISALQTSSQIDAIGE